MATVNLDPSEFPANSSKSKEEKKKVKTKKPVVTTPVKIEKPSLMRKFKDAFVAEDLETVKEDIIHNQIIPAIKDGIYDALTGFVEGLLFGSVSGRRNSKKSSYGKPSYAAYYKSDGRSSRRSSRDDDDYKSNGKIDFRDISIKDRGEAEEILSNLVDYIEEYGEATIADFLDLVEIPSDPQDNHWGWTNLSRASVRRGREGYLIDFPKTIYLD